MRFTITTAYNDLEIHILKNVLLCKKTVRCAAFKEEETGEVIGSKRKKKQENIYNNTVITVKNVTPKY